MPVVGPFDGIRLLGSLWQAWHGMEMPPQLG